MGSPTFNNIAEIIQEIWKQTPKNIFDTQNIILYTRYVEDLKIIYNTKHIT